MKGMGERTSRADDKTTGFVAFDQYKRLLADADGKVSGPRAAVAGFAAGVTESLLAVTPTESIKTQLYVFAVPFPPSFQDALNKKHRDYH